MSQNQYFVFTLQVPSLSFSSTNISRQINNGSETQYVCLSKVRIIETFVFNINTLNKVVFSLQIIKNE